VSAVTKSVATREDRGDRIGAEQRPRAAPPGRHGRGRVAQGKADQAVGADRLDVPRCHAEVMAVGAPAKPRRFWPRRRLLDGAAQTDIVQHRGLQCFDPLVLDIGGRERAGETVSSADAFLGTRQNARACAVPRFIE
jgi:hypothetical protein